MDKELLEITEQIDECYEICEEPFTRGKLFSISQKIKALTKDSQRRIMDNNQVEAIELLEKALKEKSNIQPDYSEHTIKLAADTMMVYIVDALALLRCPTCGGSKRVPDTFDKPSFDGYPCPDCADKPESQEPAKPASEFVEKVYKSGIKEKKVNYIWAEKKLLEVCDRLEAAEEENKELKSIILIAPGADEEEFETKYRQWWDLHYRELRSPGCNLPRLTFKQLQAKLKEQAEVIQKCYDAMKGSHCKEEEWLKPFVSKP